MIARQSPIQPVQSTNVQKHAVTDPLFAPTFYISLILVDGDIEIVRLTIWCIKISGCLKCPAAR